MELVVSRATQADIAALCAILTHATNYKVERGDMSWGEDEFRDKEVAHMLSKNTIYSVHFDGKIIATLALNESDERLWGTQPDDALYLHRLAVKTNYHGKGIGQQLVIWAAQEVKRQGKQFLRLDCSPQNAKLCAYYEKQGFIKIGECQITTPELYTAALYQLHI